VTEVQWTCDGPKENGTMSTKSTWDDAKHLAEKHANAGGVFVRLATHGDKVTGVFCGEPYAREVVWTGERYEAYDAKNPDHQGEGKRPSLRVAINFYVPAENAMKIIEGGTQWFKDVLKVRDKYGLDKWSFDIERHGEAKDTKTKYTILPEEKIDGALKASLAQAELHDLPAMLNGEGEAKPAPVAAKPSASGAGERGDLIEAAIAAELVGRAKLLPRASVEAWLQRLGVQRVRDLRTDQAKAARILLDQLEGKEQAEVDPFA